MPKPILIEPGTKYFLSATLKASNIKRKKNYIFYFNVALFSLFSIIVCLFLSYKYYNKPRRTVKIYSVKNTPPEFVNYFSKGEDGKDIKMIAIFTSQNNWIKRFTLYYNSYGGDIKSLTLGL